MTLVDLLQNLKWVSQPQDAGEWAWHNSRFWTVLQNWWSWCPVRMPFFTGITSGPNSTLSMWTLFPIIETQSTQGPVFHEINLTVFTWHLSVGVVTGGTSAQVRSDLCFSHYGWALLMTPPQEKQYSMTTGMLGFLCPQISQLTERT